MNRLSIEQVRNSGEFRPLRSLSFNEILPFVIENIKKVTGYSIFYFIFNGLYLCFAIGIAASSLIKGSFSHETITPLISGFLLGLFYGSLVVIPFHEGLHALAFYLQGARKIVFGADFKQLIFYATARDFVAGRKSFTVIALAPFVVINLVGLAYLIFKGQEGLFLVTVLLLTHNLMCIGDFAMLSYFQVHKDKELYTFDEVESKTAWFYERAGG